MLDLAAQNLTSPMILSFALGLAARAMAADRGGRGIVWVTDPATRVDGGGLFPAGLGQYGLDAKYFRRCIKKHIVNLTFEYGSPIYQIYVITLRAYKPTPL